MEVEVEMSLMMSMMTMTAMIDWVGGRGVRGGGEKGVDKMSTSSSKDLGAELRVRQADAGNHSTQAGREGDRR
eukprot:296739-Hanusia_phi.AAC.1